MWDTLLKVKINRLIPIVLAVLVVLILLLKLEPVARPTTQRGVINGERYKDYKACASVNSVQREKCYILGAIANNDPSICSHIDDPSTTKFRVNNCTLLAEVVNSSVKPLICEGLDEELCKNQEGCRPQYIQLMVMCPPDSPGCELRTYHNCDTDAQYFCIASGGTLDERHGCICPEVVHQGNILIKPYGCVDCYSLSNPEAKKECLRRVPCSYPQ